VSPDKPERLAPQVQSSLFLSRWVADLAGACSGRSDRCPFFTRNQDEKLQRTSLEEPQAAIYSL